MLPHDIFLRLPRPTALLILSSLAHLTSAHLARQTPSIIPHRPLNVAAYPPLPAPTSPPLDGHALNELLRRQGDNTICGYINGASALPATCSAGSHCVVDADHGVVGCCPNGEDTCTSGVYTGCVDPNSGPQTELNPYVFTCTGSNVCYQNTYEGGYSQYGCGTASDLAATVYESATNGNTAVTLTSADIMFTESPSSLATPTTLGTDTRSATRSSSKSASSDSTTTLSISAPTTTTTGSDSATTSSATTSSGSASSTTSTSTPTAAPAASGNGTVSTHTGAVVGGSIGAAVALAGLIALFFYLRRRRAGNSRQGPGPRPGDTQYISPMSGGGGAWAPLGQDANGNGHGGGKTIGGKPITHITGETGARNTVWQHGGVGDGSPPRSRGMGGATAAGVAAAGAGAGAGAAYHGAYASPHDGMDSSDDEVPLRTGSPEIDDFSRGFHDALSRIGEEDEDSAEDGVNRGGMSGRGGGGGDLGDNSRPLWLQSRRQSRNLMWT